MASGSNILEMVAMLQKINGGSYIPALLVFNLLRFNNRIFYFIFLNSSECKNLILKMVIKNTILAY
jgi:hypothetical protein